jgi:hypothetical protein
VAINKYVPRSIQNIFDRVEAYNESITKKLFSEELEKTFEVIIYASKSPEIKSRPPLTEAEQQNSSTSINAYDYFKARSLSGHHDHLIRPETATTVDEYERFRNAHFQAIIKRKSDLPYPLTGEVWLATQSGANLVTLISYERTISLKFNLEKEGPAKDAHNNSTEPTLTNADYSSTTVPTPASTSSSESSFVDKIKNSPSFSGWSPQALAGVIANAKAESAYKNLAAGDSVRFYEKGHENGRISQKRINNVRKRNVNGKCSWGYWQLNICPDDGAGKQLVDEQGIDITTEAGKKEWVKKLQDDEFQFSFVARKIASVIDIRTTDAYQAGYDITVKFERPANATEKGKVRGNSAKQIYEKYKAKLSK